MKIILTGTTGFIGQEVLRRALTHPSITSIIVLSRRQLPSEAPTSPKLKVMIHEDFGIYPDSLLTECAGAAACIWFDHTPVRESVLSSADAAAARTLSPYKGHLDDAEYLQRTEIGWPLAAVAFCAKLSPGKQFRFLFCSGMASETDQNKSLWFMQGTRRLRGILEIKLAEIAKERPDVFRAITVRPGFVLAKGASVMRTLGGFFPAAAIKVEVLAAAMVQIAVDGSESQTVDNPDLKAQGQKLLEAKPKE